MFPTKLFFIIVYINLLGFRVDFGKR